MVPHDLKTRYIILEALQNLAVFGNYQNLIDPYGAVWISIECSKPIAVELFCGSS